MATVNTRSCEVRSAISTACQALILNLPAGWIRIEHPDLDGRLHDTSTWARLEMLTRWPKRIEGATEATANSPRRPTSGQR